MISVKISTRKYNNSVGFVNECLFSFFRHGSFRARIPIRLSRVWQDYNSHLLLLSFFIPFFLWYSFLLDPLQKNIYFTRNYQNNLFACVLNPPSEKRKENNDAHRKHSLLLFQTNAFYCNTQHTYLSSYLSLYMFFRWNTALELLILITIEAASHAKFFSNLKVLKKSCE